MRASPYSMGCKDLFYRPLLVILIILLLQCVSSFSVLESEALLKFKGSVGNNVKLLSWDAKISPCMPNTSKSNWFGIICVEGKVWGIKLENMGLTGVIDVESLQELPNLRTISLMHNAFNGTFPKLNKMVALKTIYFSGNKFSGEIDPNAFEGMHSLKKIHLAHNEFSGSIPSSLTTLQKLVELHIEDNKFYGEIPDFKLGIMRNLNVSNNQLQGQIPTSLNKIDPSSFSGNGDLCGSPLQECPPKAPPPSTPSSESPPSTPTPSSSSKSPPVKTIIIAAVGGVALVAIFVLIFIFFCKHSGKSPKTVKGGAPLPLQHGGERSVPSNKNLDNMERAGAANSTSAAAAAGGSKKGENVAKLTFLRDDIERFELGDLLKASAEVLGSGYFGSSYRAALTNGKMMVVKRFRHMNNVGKEEFQEHMRRIGRLTHPNLLPLVAFYYRKEEKLLVADYIDNVNLAVHLHGNRSRGHPSPNWATRLGIIKGVAKGLQYLYNELPSLMLPHGHLKSSNVLLTPSMEPLLTDYALVPVVNQEHAQDVMVAYKSPEYKHSGRVSKKTDVWSFGILILEILTGKFPSNFLQQGKGGSETDLVSWVESAFEAAGDWNSSEVFDKEMGEVVKSSESQMVKLLKIGMACAHTDVDKRWDLKEALSRIEEVKEKDTDDEFYSFATSEGDAKFEKSR